MKSPDAHSLVVFSSPRTGTHAICRIFELIGLQKNVPLWPATFASDDIAKSISILPKNGFYISGAHSDPNEVVKNAFLKSGIKGVVITRDIRDTIVSLAHFGRQGIPIKEKSLDCRISEHIPLALFHYHRMVGWRQVPGIYSTTYERIFQQTRHEIRSIARHAGIVLTEDELNNCVENFPPDKGEKPSPVFFRKGIVGDWRNFFKPYHVFAVKYIAGSILIQEGYEKDLNWEL